MKRLLKTILLLVFLIVIVKLFWAVSLATSGETLLKNTAQNDVYPRRNYLLLALKNGEMDTAAMPDYLGVQFKGEWALVSYSMTASALTNIAFRYPETLTEARESLAKIITKTLQADIKAFDTYRWDEDPLTSLDGDNGHIGYLGHLNWILGAYTLLGGSEHQDLFRDVSEALARRLEKKFCLETYPNEIRYSADNLVVVASLAVYSRTHNNRFGTLLGDWLQWAKEVAASTDSGLLPFYLNTFCRAVGPARGSAAGWNSYYLPFIDQAFANKQYAELKNTFAQHFIITGIREYPHGVFGLGDVDSGPVIFGLSPSGTGFAVGGAMHAEDTEFVSQLLFTSELAGSSFKWGDSKHYMLSPLVGEAIMLAMKTALVWDNRFILNQD